MEIILLADVINGVLSKAKMVRDTAIAEGTLFLQE